MLKMMLAITIATVAATPVQAASLNGLWMRGDGKARVRIAPCGNQFCAVNEWIKPGTADEKVGDKLILNISPSNASAYAGTANDPQRGLTYKIDIQVRAQTMTTQGCVVAGLLCKSVNWSRLQ